MDNCTYITYAFPDGKSSYVVNGVPTTGWFSVDYTMKDLSQVFCKFSCFKFIVGLLDSVLLHGSKQYELLHLIRTISNCCNKVLIVPFFFLSICWLIVQGKISALLVVHLNFFFFGKINEGWMGLCADSTLLQYILQIFEEWCICNVSILRHKYFLLKFN